MEQAPAWTAVSAGGFSTTMVNKESMVENNENPVAAEIGQDSKNLGLLIWIGTIFFGFIPSLILFLVKKDDPYVLDQSKEALNWAITAMIGYVAGMILTVILIGPLVCLAVWICSLVFCIMGAMAVSNGKTFRVPFALRLIK